LSLDTNFRETNPDQTLPGCVLPAKASPVEELFDWSQNFDSFQNPFTLFLAVIGYYEEEYGESLSPSNFDFSKTFGYIELRLLGSALNVFETESFDTVYEWCRTLLSADE